MTRGMLVTVLYRLAGSPKSVADSGFADVAAGKYYADAVSWAAENGIVKMCIRDSSCSLRSRALPAFITETRPE